MMKSISRFVIAACLCFTAGCLSHIPFQGGQLHKSRGLFFSTIYLADFQELDLNKDGQYEITFRGFPDSPVFVDLEVVGPTAGEEKLLRQFTPDITLELNEAHGTPVCKATGKLNQHYGVVDHNWVLAPNRGSGYFWNSDCLWLKIRRDQAYMLRITVRAATETLGSLRARPRLWTPHD
jgi:hypothetical protein